MPQFKTIQLSEIRILRDFSQSKPGTLLQISASDLPVNSYEHEQAVIGLRSEILSVNVRKQGLVLLEGVAAGTFISNEELTYRPAFDVTALARLEVRDCNPHIPIDHHRLSAGAVYGIIDQSEATSLCMAVRAPGDDPVIIGYVELVGARRGQITSGESYVYLGRAVVAHCKESIEESHLLV